jgi:hypothetical protein
MLVYLQPNALFGYLQPNALFGSHLSSSSVLVVHKYFMYPSLRSYQWMPFSNHTLKLVSVWKSPTSMIDVIPQHWDLRKLIMYTSVSLQPKELSYYYQVHISSEMFQVYNISMYPNSRRCLKAPQSFRQQSGPTGVRLPYPQHPTE